MRETLQSIRKILEEKQNILIACPERLLSLDHPLGADALTSAITLFDLLTKQGKNIEVVMSKFQLEPEWSFLPHLDKIKNHLTATQPFVIRLPTGNKNISDFSYNIENNELKIFITPAEGKLDKTKVQFEHLPSIYDLIITVDAPNLGALGAIYHDHRDIFQSTPIINIDHSPKNNRYGQINYIDITAASVTELLLPILKIFEDEPVTRPEIATQLLAGLISKTNSFKSTHLKPHTLELASKLIAAGAEREKIVNHFYRTKNIKTLKLWGRILARLKGDENIGLFWSLINHDDFLATETSPESIPSMINEILYSNPEARYIMLFYEYIPREISVLAATNTSTDIREIILPYETQGNEHKATITLKQQNLLLAEKEFIAHLKQKLTTQLSS